jgi:hypothetical protein
MASKTVTIQAGKKVEFNLVVDSPHVVAYRIWTRTSDQDPWQDVHGGKTGDLKPEFNALSVTSGTRLAYWLGVGGNPGTRFRVILTLGQDGQLLANGTLVVEGTTDDSGVARVEAQDVVFA